MIQIAVQGRVVDRTQWIDLVTTVERLGFHGLCVADHRGSTSSPFVALAAAAMITDRITLGTCVLNAGLWTPMELATEATTLNEMSNGRCVLGIGAGHTPSEWSMIGAPMPTAGEKVERMIDLVTAVRALIAGNVVTASNNYFTLSEAQITANPTDRGIPILVGGNGQRVLSFAAVEADVVGVSGLGRTLADGHSHEVAWSPAQLNKTFERIAALAGEANRAPDIEALVQHVEITNDAERSAERIAELVPGATPADLLDAPFMWIGTVEEITAQINEYQKSWGITRYVIRDSSLDAASEVLRSLQHQT
ncbi:MAG: TIGR03621 family F420-dependent LLM class oxidoreductase [Actinomycetes bacterium]